MNKNRKFISGLIVFIVILVIAIGAYIASKVTGSSSDSDFSFSVNGREITNTHGTVKTEKGRTSSKGKYAAILHIEGTIQAAGDTYNQQWINSNIEKFQNDKNNIAIILFINSPGGTVYESDETYLALQKYKSSGKKVYAYLGSMAASGGYYIACAADKIYANRNTLTGSIGVIAGNFIDITEFLEDHGIYYTTIHAGKNKNMGNYNEPVTDEQIEIMQSIADEAYDQFTSIVSTSRHIPYNEILPLCDGRIYTAGQALSNGLIDGFGTWDQFVDFVEGEYPDLIDSSFVHYSYQRQKGLFQSMISSFTGNQKAETLDGIPSGLWEQMNLKGPMYLYRN